MKKSIWLLLTVFLVSCSSSNDVVSNGPISKRKYRKGWNIDFVQKRHVKQEHLVIADDILPTFDAPIEHEKVNQIEVVNQSDTPIEREDQALLGKEVSKSESVRKNPIQKGRELKAKTSSYLSNKLEKEIAKYAPNGGIEKDKPGGDDDKYTYITLGGILSMLFTLGWVPFLNVLLAIAFVVTGILALIHGQSRGLAILAFIASILFLLLSIAWSAVFVIAFTI